jgi:hypothetical protein
MSKQEGFMKISLKLAVVLIFFSLLAVRPTDSYAYWHDHGYVSVHLGVWPGAYYYGSPYYYPYYADPYYYPTYPASYSVVSSSSYQPVVVNGVTYYVNNGVYYIYTQYGYQAVAAPAGVTAPVIQPAPAASAPAVASPDNGDAITVNIPNNKGGYTAVVLKRSGNGFVGPQGEFYSEFPKVSQLQTMYGK